MTSPDPLDAIKPDPKCPKCKNGQIAWEKRDDEEFGAHWAGTCSDCRGIFGIIRTKNDDDGE